MGVLRAKIDGNWVDLATGTPGPPGATGPAGAPGTPGAPGAAGGVNEAPVFYDGALPATTAVPQSLSIPFVTINMPAAPAGAKLDMTITALVESAVGHLGGFIWFTVNGNVVNGGPVIWLADETSTRTYSGRVVNVPQPVGIPYTIQMTAAKNGPGGTLNLRGPTGTHMAVVSYAPVTPSNTAIIERATTPAGLVNELRWSTIHQAFLRWNGTQWLFAGGPPSYFISDDMWGVNGNFTMTPLTVGGNTILADSPPHYGINRATSGNSTTSGESYRGVASIANLSAAAGLRMRGVFLLPNVAANTLQRIGFHDWSVPATAPVDGAWLEVVAGVASFKTSAASVVTTNATTVMLVQDTWYTTHVWFPTATTARCIVIKDDGTVVLDVTNTTNIPAGANKFGVAAAAVFTANVPSTILLDVDWMGWGYAPV